MNYIEWFVFFMQLAKSKGYFTTGEASNNVMMSRQTTQRYIKKFCKVGYLKRVSHGKYEINMEHPSVIDVFDAVSMLGGFAQ